MFRPRRILVILGCAAIWAASFSSPVRGETADEPQAGNFPGAIEPAATALPEAKAESLESLIVENKASQELTETAQAEILAVVQETHTELGRAASFAKQAAQFERARQRVPESLAALHAQLAEPPRVARPVAPIDATANHLEARLAEVQDQLSEAQTELTRLEAEPQRRNERRLKGIP